MVDTHLLVFLFFLSCWWYQAPSHAFHIPTTTTTTTTKTTLSHPTLTHKLPRKQIRYERQKGSSSSSLSHKTTTTCLKLATTTSTSDQDALLVDELLEILSDKIDKTGTVRRWKRQSQLEVSEKQRLQRIFQELETSGSDVSYLDEKDYIGHDQDENNVNNNISNEKNNKLLWDNYELAYFDRSIDAQNNTTTASNNNKKPSSKIRSKILGCIFGLRYSFQNIIPPNTIINYVGFKFFGLPASVTAGGTFTRIMPHNDDENNNNNNNNNTLLSIQKEFGTQLRNDTTVRIDFDRPLLSFGLRRLPLVLGMGDGAQSPPVTLSVTYMDERVRLALAAKGGRLVFTRGGRASESVADGWKGVVDSPLRGRRLGVLLLLLGGLMSRSVPKMRGPVRFLAISAGMIVALTRLGSSGRVEK